MQEDSHEDFQADPNEYDYFCFSQPKKLRACYICHLVKTQGQFNVEGCDNCQFFKQKGFSATDYTSSHFESVVSIIDPQTSWVARHMGIEQMAPGTYCRKIRDDPNIEIIQEVKSLNIPVAFNTN